VQKEGGCYGSTLGVSVKPVRHCPTRALPGTELDCGTAASVAAAAAAGNDVLCNASWMATSRCRHAPPLPPHQQQQCLPLAARGIALHDHISLYNSGRLAAISNIDDS